MRRFSDARDLPTLARMLDEAFRATPALAQDSDAVVLKRTDLARLGVAALEAYPKAPGRALHVVLYNALAGGGKEQFLQLGPNGIYFGTAEQEDVNLYRGGANLLRSDDVFQPAGLKLAAGAGAGRVLTSDASGLASWQDAGGSSETPNLVRKTILKSGVASGATPLFKVETSGGGFFQIAADIVTARISAAEVAMHHEQYSSIGAHLAGGARRLACASAEYTSTLENWQTNGGALVLSVTGLASLAASDAREDFTLTIDFSGGSDESTPAGVALDIQIRWGGYSSAPVITAL